MSEKCSSCGQPVIPGAIFCDNCGNRLAPVAPPAPVAAPAPAAAPSSGLIPCPVCKVENIPGAAFCENCGTSLAVLPSQPAVEAAPPAVPFAEPIPPEPLSPPAQQPEPPAPAFVEYVPTPLVAEVPPDMPPAAPPREPPAAQTAPPAPVFITGSFQVAGTGTVISIPAGKSEILVGREDPVSGNFPDVNLDPYEALNLGVSRQHCKLTIQGQQVMIEDLNSVNKTYLRGLPLVPGQRYPLQGEDEILLGRLRLVYNQ